MSKFREYIARCSQVYYEGKPIISNEEFDALEAIYGQTIGGSGDVKHMFRMFSLKKHYEKDGALPLNKSKCEKTLKLDGAAVDVFYLGGKFQHALTRGDGVVGRDITEKLRSLNIPLEIPSTKPTQVTGEVVADKGVENSRNYASGALGHKDLGTWEQRKTNGDMRFIAYNVQQVQNQWGIGATYREDMELLKSYGFCTVLDSGTNWDTKYPIDGYVYRLSCNKEFNDAGFTDKFPRGAVAWKAEQESVETTLLDVEWQTGKSGKVTPVAILEPVTIGEAKVARATLNNISYIEALDLEIGCTVQVIRSGEIIPKIIGRVY